MLKVIYRLFMIVLIFGLVSGGIYAYVNSSGGQAALGRGGFGDRGGFDRGAPPSGTVSLSALGLGQLNGLSAGANTLPRGDFGGREFRGGIGGGRFSLAGIATNLAEIGMITLLVVLVQKAFKMSRRVRVRAA